jgi:predicted transcriptional regulator
MINSLNTYSALLNSSSSVTSNTSEVDNIIAEHKASSTENEAVLTGSSSNLYLSNRAQKINAISNEFFSKDALNFNDVDALKERVYQLGLISKNEYTALTDSSSQAESESSKSSDKTISIVDFISSLLERLENDDNESNADGTNDFTSAPEEDSAALTALIKALESAKYIISDVEEAKRGSDFKANLQDTLLLLKETIEAPSFEKIPLDDKVSLSKVYQTLEIVDQLSPERLNNEKLNKYMDLSFS